MLSSLVELFNGKGGLIQGLIHGVDRSGLDVVALEDPKLVLPQSTQWHVFAAFGTLKGGRADWLVEKCTELGASSLTPLLTERSPTVSENRLNRLISPNDKIEYSTEKEVNELMQAGAISVGLGPHRLRVETATVALLATLMLWSDSQKACDTSSLG
ncbi:uncharacterized protein LOC117638546 [Prunus dulcis]|uniref:uncharacterized protein LOC117638546 n=1 Tax=Prunus dulcis TaxID=3755 RepID=UPI001483CDFF|nr:uncharacterized protein LOC117638546 [Prunus dulcis]